MRKFKLRILFILLSNGLAESIPQDPQKFGNLPYFTLARSAVGQPSPAPPAPALPPPAISPSSNGSPISVPPPAPPAAVTPIPPAQLSVPPPAVPAASSPLPAVPLPQTSAASGAGQLPPQPVAVPPPPGLGTPAAPSNVGPASFGQILQIAGNMARTDITLKDGFGIDLLSPKNRSMIVLQNNKPLSGNFVTGASGSGFMALSPYSYVVRTSDLANDLIAKVELPFNREAIANAGVKSGDTFVGKLAPDGKSWQVVEDQRNVHNQEDKTRIEKMTSIAGEYMLLGRKNVDDGNIFIQYGSGEELAVSIAGGQGVQQAEYIDGLRLTIESAGKMSINADVKALSGPNVLPKGVMSLNTFSWVFNTNGFEQQAPPPPAPAPSPPTQSSAPPPVAPVPAPLPPLPPAVPSPGPPPPQPPAQSPGAPPPLPPPAGPSPAQPAPPPPSLPPPASMPLIVTINPELSAATEIPSVARFQEESPNGNRTGAQPAPSAVMPKGNAPPAPAGPSILPPGLVTSSAGGILGQQTPGPGGLSPPSSSLPPAAAPPVASVPPGVPAPPAASVTPGVASAPAISPAATNVPPPGAVPSSPSPLPPAALPPASQPPAVATPAAPQPPVPAPGVSASGIQAVTLEFPVNLAILNEQLNGQAAGSAPNSATAPMPTKAPDFDLETQNLVAVPSSLPASLATKVQFAIGYRSPAQATGPFEPLNGLTVGMLGGTNLAMNQGEALLFDNNKLTLSGMTKLEGEYVILVSMNGAMPVPVSQNTPEGQGQPRKMGEKNIASRPKVSLGLAFAVGLLVVFIGF